jgi:cytochrome c556
MTVRSGAAGLAASFLLLAGVDAAMPAQAPVAAPSAAQLIAARQAAFDMSVQAFGAMRKAAEEGRDPKNSGYAAIGLTKWAQALPGLFPRGTVRGQTDIWTQAEPTIWSDRKGFEEAAANYAAAAAELGRRAEANDLPGFKAQLAEVGEVCSACHATYKGGPK